MISSCVLKEPRKPTPTPTRRTNNLFAYGSGFLGYRSLSLSGVAFYRDRLFAASDRGLFEIVDGKLAARLNWMDADDVIEELFYDKVHGYLWLRPARTQMFVRFDGQHWNFEALPTTLGTRGEQLRGFEMFNSGSDLYVASASALWRWDPPTAQWLPVELPTLNCSGQEPENPPRCFARGAANMHSLFVVVSRTPDGWRYGSEFVNPGEENSDVLMFLDEGTWKPVADSLGRFFFVKEMISGGNAAFVLTTKNELFSVTAKGLADIPSPGKVDKIAASSAGNLLASVKDLGIFEFATHWERRSGAMPTGSGVIVHMAEDNGRLVYSVSYTRPGLGGECELNAGASIWWVTNGSQMCVTAE